MKKILVFLITLFSFWLFFQNDISAFTITTNNTVINWEVPKIPYCNWEEWKECGFDKWVEKAKEWITSIETEKTAVEYVQDIVLYVFGFLFFVTVLIIIWAWVTILMSAWNDDKVENAKKIIINCVIWICVIFLAYPIARFVIWTFDKAKTGSSIIKNI